MSITPPGKRLSRRLATSRVFGKGLHYKKGTFVDLLITPLVDMFVIIVIFLLQSFSANGEILFMSKDITLPEAVNGRDIERSPLVRISDRAVMVEGEEVALVASLGRDEYWNIPVLEDRLRDLKKRYEVLHQTDPTGGSTRDINIQAHKEVPFQTLKRVMYSCNQAGYLNINFAVMPSGAPEK